VKVKVLKMSVVKIPVKHLRSLTDELSSRVI